jgi:hypothetical protein
LGRYSLIAEKSGLERLSREGSNLGDVATQVPVNADADVLHEWQAAGLPLGAPPAGSCRT